MVKISSIQVVLRLVTNLNLEIKRLDVKTNFLHDDLNEKIYIKLPEGFKVKGKKI